VAFLTRALLVLAAVGCASELSAEQETAERAYIRAVAGFFQVTETEVAILGHGGEVATEDLPVVLFMARRGGVSAEAVAALRESGRPWPELARRFGVGANALHFPVSDSRGAGVLAGAYERYAATPVDQWPTMRLESAEIVALVNVRVLSEALGVEPGRVAARTSTIPTFVELYASFLR
jgi:hypothetical protein